MRRPWNPCETSLSRVFLSVLTDVPIQVAGIIGADLDPIYNFTGVAPMANLRAYRVFGCKGGVGDDVLVQALIRAYKEGNDIITLSLGVSTRNSTCYCESTDVLFGRELEDGLQLYHPLLPRGSPRQDVLLLSPLATTVPMAVGTPLAQAPPSMLSASHLLRSTQTILIGRAAC